MLVFLFGVWWAKRAVIIDDKGISFDQSMIYSRVENSVSTQLDGDSDSTFN